ncbi:MAG: HEAT repeat domain-containing protein [Gemmatimonadetes bacterium]|nr:HEAT repeat domain-containing protein [Gemmatimonadota bacterium]
MAREQLNRGDYRRAVALFKEVAAQFPNSPYAAEAPYWQAFALYRIGGTGDLQEALQVLDQQRTKYPAARTQADAAALATRIAGVLASRGQGDKELVKRALNTGAPVCDREDLAVRAEALNALMQSEPDAAFGIAQKILGRRDECAADLRRSTVFMLGNRKEPQAAQLMLQVARSEPNSEVRADAVSWIGRLPGDESLAVLEEIAAKGDDERVQRAAVRALAAHPNARARQATRALLERNDANERIRMAVVDAFSGDRMTGEDASWLRSVYPKIESPRVKSRILQVMSQLKGDDAMQWLLGIARNPQEPSEARMTALRGAGRSVDVPSLGKFYDGAGDRALRETVIDLLGERKENEATDKLIEIVRTGTDPNLRRMSINALTRKKDPRTTKLLLDIIDR